MYEHVSQKTQIAPGLTKTPHTPPTQTQDSARFHNHTVGNTFTLVRGVGGGGACAGEGWGLRRGEDGAAGSDCMQTQHAVSSSRCGEGCGRLAWGGRHVGKALHGALHCPCGSSLLAVIESSKHGKQGVAQGRHCSQPNLTWMC